MDEINLMQEINAETTASEEIMNIDEASAADGTGQADCPPEDAVADESNIDAAVRQEVPEDCTEDIAMSQNAEKKTAEEEIQEPAQKAEKKLTAEQRRRINIGITAFLLAVMVCATAWLLPASAQINIGSQYDRSSDINTAVESGISNIASTSLQDIYDLPEVYMLPVSCEPAPVPKEENFTIELDKTGVRVDSGTYSDATITVTIWKEYTDDTIYNFADVKINHPTQFRTMFATGDYTTASRCDTPLNMAKQSNAVVAISSDFCRYNQNGTLVVRGGNFYKHTPAGWEVLLIDEDGNFNFAIDRDVELETTANGVEWNGRVIYNTFSFGPVLVRDGTAVTDFSNVKAAIHGKYLTGDATVARAAIGQLGELHYLLCTVDGTRGETAGVTLPQLAVMLESKGCINAYNLDGGHSATLVFNNTLVNIPASKDNTGAQRAQSDIIYFASAIPNE